MKRPIFTDANGPVFEDARGDLRDRRGQLLTPEHQANIREILRMVQACQATEPAIPPHALARLKTSATLRAGDTEFLRKPAHSMDDPSQPPA